MKTNKNIIVIVAYDNQKAIGLNNELLWHISEDLKRFKSLTSGNTIIMGRKTFDSIGRALPNRQNIVISRNENLQIENVLVCQNIQDAIDASTTDNIYIIGGAQIYKQVIDMDIVNKLEITEVDSTYKADAFFPEFDKNKWTLINQVDCSTSGDTPLKYSFKTYIKS